MDGLCISSRDPKGKEREEKTGSPSVLMTIKASPGLQAAYQLHGSVNAPSDSPPEEFMANLKDSPDGKWVRVSAVKDGSFRVTNGRYNVSEPFSKQNPISK